MKILRPAFVPLYLMFFLLGGCAGNFARPDMGGVLVGDSKIVIKKDGQTSSENPDLGAKDIGIKKDTLSYKDLGKKDVGTTAANSCATGYSLSFNYGTNMVICKDNGGGNKNQCNASDMCNSSTGWQLCTASQYLSRDGKTVAPGAEAPTAWIRGCTRENEMTKEAGPDDDVCPCVGAVTNPWNQAFPCGTSGSSGDYIQSTAQNLGAVTNTGCYYLGYGGQAKATSGYWYFRAAVDTLTGAVCCK